MESETSTTGAAVRARTTGRIVVGLVAALAVAACSTPPPGWPAGLRTVGDGWPAPGDPCRVIGETAATVDLLDHDATLVGCRSDADAARLGGRIVARVEGIVLLSVPARPPGDGDGRGDATVAGTDFHATAVLRCSGVRGAGPGSCDAGVRRHGPGGTAAVEVRWPDGGRRVLLFDRAARAIAAEAAPGEQAPPPVSSTRLDDRITVVVGAERYEMPDVFVLGD